MTPLETARELLLAGCIVSIDAKEFEPTEIVDLIGLVIDSGTAMLTIRNATLIPNGVMMTIAKAAGERPHCFTFEI